MTRAFELGLSQSGELGYQLGEQPAYNGGGFSPGQISDLAVWLDANDFSTFTFNGGNVSAWADKSGNSNDATQGTAANQPLYETDEVNGKPVITCNNDFLQIPDNATLDYTEAQIFNVIRNNVDSGTGDNRYFSKWTSNPNLEILAGLKNDGTPDAYNVGFATDASTRVFNTSISQVTLGTAAIIDFNIMTGTTDVRVNNGTTTVVGAGGYNSAAPLQIGASFGNGNFSIAEVLFFTRSLTTSEFTSVINYLSNKWGITLS